MTTPADRRTFFLDDVSNDEPFFGYSIVPDGRADHPHGQWEESLPLSQALRGKEGGDVVESVHEGKPITVKVVGFGHGTVGVE